MGSAAGWAGSVDTTGVALGWVGLSSGVSSPTVIQLSSALLEGSSGGGLVVVMVGTVCKIGEETVTDSSEEGEPCWGMGSFGCELEVWGTEFVALICCFFCFFRSRKARKRALSLLLLDGVLWCFLVGCVAEKSQNPDFPPFCGISRLFPDLETMSSVKLYSRVMAKLPERSSLIWLDLNTLSFNWCSIRFPKSSEILSISVKIFPPEKVCVSIFPDMTSHNLPWRQMSCQLWPGNLLVDSGDHHRSVAFLSSCHWRHRWRQTIFSDDNHDILDDRLFLLSMTVFKFSKLGNLKNGMLKRKSPSSRISWLSSEKLVCRHLWRQKGNT